MSLYNNFYIMLKRRKVTFLVFTDNNYQQFMRKVAGVKGLEPSTYRVTGDRSNQLSYTPTFSLFWWAVKDSNLWPPRCKRDALPTELTALNQNKVIYIFWENNVKFYYYWKIGLKIILLINLLKVNKDSQVL